MSTGEILQQLETCAQIIMAPPANITANDRSKAEEIFLNFQKTKSPFDLCREILETSQNNFVLYQVGTCLKNAVIREWSEFGVEKACALFNYLFEYVNRRQPEQYVIEELMIVCAVIYKRISIDPSQQSDAETNFSKTIIMHLFEVIKNPESNIKMRLNACAAIIQILNEYSSLNYNSDYCLTWYAHLLAKRKFENTRFKDIFKTTIEVLFNHMKSSQETKSIEWIRFGAKLIRICEMILSWNFNFVLETFSCISLQYMKSRDRIENTMFNPPNDWMELIVEGNLISFFFELYISFRGIDPDLLHSAFNCLTQLSTMSPIRYTTSLTIQFVEKFMINTIQLCNMMINAMSHEELFFLSNLFNSICVNLRSNTLTKLCDMNLVKNFLDSLFKLTYKVLFDSIKVRMAWDRDEYDKYTQSTEFLIHSCIISVTSINYVRQVNQELQDTSNFNEIISNDQLVAWSKPLFETYLRVHLSEPEGLLPLACFQDTDEIQEFEDDDNTLYREQLIAIGSIAQVDLLNSINLITQLMILKLQQLEACIRSEGNLPEKMIQWTRICEDIHWIIMISTYIFTSYSENEIPSEIVKISIQASSDIQATQTALQNGDFMAANIDPVVRYFIVIFKFVQLEKNLLDNGMSQWVSPQVSYSLTYFISRFMHIYLVPAEFDADRSEMSLSLNSCFGADSPNAKNMINYFLDHLETKFMTLSSEAKVLEYSSVGLRIFCKYRERIKLLQECASLHRLLQRFPFDPHFRKLPSAVRRNMYQVFIVVFAENNDMVINPLMQLYEVFRNQLISGQIEQNQEEFQLIVDFTMGISNGLTASTFNNVWKKFILPFYNDMPQVLKIMHKCSIVVQAILELLYHFCLSFANLFQDEDNSAFYNTAVSILNEYALHTKDTYTIDSNRIDEIQSEFIWILKFLNELSAQEIYLIFINPTNSTSLSNTIAKVVLTSLNTIMPLINQIGEQLLDNDRLCILYYKLLEFISQDTERFRGFPIRLLESYLKSVEYAFKASNVSNEIKTIGFKILVEIGRQTSSDSSTEEILQFLKPFFRTIIEFIFCELVRNNDLVLREAVANALYSLICCFADTYQDIIRETMRCIGDPQTELTICNALFEIIAECGLDYRYNQMRLRFKKKFSEFINKLNALLSLR